MQPALQPVIGKAAGNYKFKCVMGAVKDIWGVSPSLHSPWVMNILSNMTPYFLPCILHVLRST